MRLIDADTLIAQIWSEHKKTEESYDLCVDELKEVFCGIVTLIDAQPTAYYLDKVVEQLQDKSCKYMDIWCTTRKKADFAKMEAFDEAEEIVKGGGVDGN